MTGSAPSYTESDCGLIPRALANHPRLPYSRKVRAMTRHPTFPGDRYEAWSRSLIPSKFVDMTASPQHFSRGRERVLNHACEVLGMRPILHFEVRFSKSERLLGWYAVTPC